MKRSPGCGRAPRSTGSPAGPVRDGLAAAGVGFAAIGGPLEARWRQAVVELDGCVRVLDAGLDAPVLVEGGVYPGTWIEGTSSISAEVLTRFAPAVARAHPGAVRGSSSATTG